jgi:hypothetical protein
LGCCDCFDSRSRREEEEEGGNMEGLEEEAEILNSDLSALQGEVEKGLRSMQATESTSIQAIEDASKKINGRIGKIRVMLRELEALSEEAGEDELFKSLAKKVSDQKRRLEGNRDGAKRTFSEAGRRLKAHVAKTEREELLGRSPQKAKASGGGAFKNKDELQAAEKVTSSLQKTRQLLARQLDHTESTLGIMDDSQATLSKVNETYGEHSGLLRTGKRLLNSLESQEKLERFLLYLCFCFFLLVVAYIVSKRFLFFAPVHKLLLHKNKQNSNNDVAMVKPPSTSASTSSSSLSSTSADTSAREMQDIPPPVAQLTEEEEETAAAAVTNEQVQAGKSPEEDRRGFAAPAEEVGVPVPPPVKQEQQQPEEKREKTEL